MIGHKLPRNLHQKRGERHGVDFKNLCPMLSSHQNHLVATNAIFTSVQNVCETTSPPSFSICVGSQSNIAFNTLPTTLCDPCVFLSPPPARRLCGLWRLCGWSRPCCPSCVFTTPTASTSAGPVCPARRSSCCLTLPRTDPRLLRILRQHPPSLSECCKKQNTPKFTPYRLKCFRRIIQKLRSMLSFFN